MRHFLFFLCFLLCAQNAFAVTAKEKKNSTMPVVTVRAEEIKSSLTVPGLDSVRETLGRVPGGASVVDSEDYKTGRTSTLQDSLGYTAGVYVQPRFGSDEARLSIRGSGIQRTFHLRGIKLLQDGIPINQADGAGDFQSIEPSALQYVEVLRGGNALQYGSTTLGGAINFVSQTGYTAPLVQGRIEAGGFNYFKSQISSGEVIGPADYFVSLSESAQKGFRNQAEQENKRIFSNYGIRFNDNIETRFYVNLVDSKSKLPGSLTYAQMKQNPKQPNPTNLSLNQKRDYDLVQLGNKTTVKWDNQTFETGGFYAHKDLHHPIFQVIDQVSHDFGAFFRYLNEADVFSRKNLFTIGFNPVWNFVNAQQHVNSGGDVGALTAFAIQRSANIDLYAEDQFYALEKLALVGGLQWSYADRRNMDRFFSDTTGDNTSHPHFVGVSPKAGVRYEINEHDQLFANVSRSFEPPSFGELSGLTGGGLRNLVAQTATTLEFGTRGEHDRFGWDLAYYFSWVENELLSLNLGGGATATVNAYSTHHQGIELGGHVDLLQGIFAKKAEDAAQTEASKGFNFWKDILGQPEKVTEPDRLVLRGIYNWSRFNFENDPAFSDNPLPGIPAHFIRFELTYEHPRGFYFGPNFEGSTEYAVDMNNTLFTYPYALLGLKGGYRMPNGVSFFVEAKNLTNETYAATTGIITNAGGLDSAQFLPGDGRTVISGVEFRW